MPTAEDLVVVRGGVVVDIDTIRQLLEDSVEDGFQPVLSVFAEVRDVSEPVVLAAQRIARTAQVRNTKIQTSTASALAAEGFTLVNEFEVYEHPSHHHVYFDWPIRDDQLQNFIDCFEQPVPSEYGLEEKARAKK